MLAIECSRQEQNPSRRHISLFVQFAFSENFQAAHANIETTDSPEAIIRIANHAVARSDLGHARVGLTESKGKWVPAVAFVFVQPKTKFVGTLTLMVPDEVSALMDLAMGILWQEVNTVEFSEAPLDTGTRRFFSMRNCPVELLDRGHLKAAIAELEKNSDKCKLETQTGWEEKLRQLKRASAEKEEESRLKCVGLNRRSIEARGLSRSVKLRFALAGAATGAFALPAAHLIVQLLK